MKGFLKFVGLCTLISTTPVTGLNFAPTPNSFVIGDTGTLTMRCDINEADLDRVYNLKIKRETYPGSNSEQVLAQFDKDYRPQMVADVNEKDFQVEGSLDNQPYLQMSMNIQKMDCSDARMYQCELAYESTSFESKTERQNITLQAFVLPAMMPPLQAKKNGIVIEGGDASDKAQFAEGDLLELTCKANIGSKDSTRIQWRKSSQMYDNIFNEYQPPAGTFEDSEALPYNQCAYTRSSTIRYNVTAFDATNDLAFECYVQVTGYPPSTSVPGGSYTTTNSLKYYVDVSSSTTPSPGASSAGAGGNVGAIIGGVIGGLVAIIIIVVVIWFLLFRRRDAETYTTKEEYGSENPNMAPPLDTYAAVDKIKKRGHENRGLDEPHESDRSRRHHYDNNRGAKANYGMDRDVDDYDGYDRDGSPTMGHQGINHMGLDPVDGRIGTGV